MELNRELERLGRAKEAAQNWDLLGDHLLAEQAQLDKGMYDKLERGLAITPDEALQFIHAKYANFRFIRKLAQTMKAGETAGMRLKGFMEEGEQNG